jgi:hypothetical protein
MSALATAYADETVLIAARDEPCLPPAEPVSHPHTAWDDLPVIPCGLDQEVPF